MRTSCQRHGPAVVLVAAALGGPAAAQTQTQSQPATPSAFAGWQAGAVLDLSATSRELALGQRDKGLNLGHSDLSAYGPLGRHLEAQFTAAVHTAERKLEGELEEAWLQTRTLPGGLQLRAGRFSSQLGYLNEQHPHADDFVDRPLLYRAFLGGHWFDDGLRLNWTAPTDLYLRLGAEVFRGKQLVKEAASVRRPGAAVLSAKAGGDLGTSHSWQAGLSLLHNRREAAVEGHEEEEEGGEEHGHEEHAHAHGAAFSGRRMWIGELAWKWAPDGNNSREQLRVAYEFAQVRDLNRFATSSDRHTAQYLSVVYRFASVWEVGARHDILRVRTPHEDHFDDGRLRESALMLAWKPSHAQTLRLQFTRQHDGGGFAQAARAVQLQYILSFGAHASHTF
jgi:hypothetical protein